jgi:hypothetical protein
MNCLSSAILSLELGEVYFLFSSAQASRHSFFYLISLFSLIPTVPDYPHHDQAPQHNQEPRSHPHIYQGPWYVFWLHICLGYFIFQYVLIKYDHERVIAYRFFSLSLSSLRLFSVLFSSDVTVRTFDQITRKFNRYKSMLLVPKYMPNYDNSKRIISMDFLQVRYLYKFSLYLTRRS